MSVFSSIVSAVKTISSQIVTAVVKYDPIKEASTLNFSVGETLAPLQDKYLADLSKTPTDAQIRVLENDVWIPLAEKLAPNNLVIRQLCLIDYFRNNVNNYSRILKLMNTLSYKVDQSGVRIWSESYSYFEYTMNAVRPWIAKFATRYSIQTNTINTLATKIYNGFVATSYKRGTVFYPAPFGDLWPVALASNLQQAHTPANITIGPVKMNVSGGVVTSYNITARPLGCNLHIPASNYTSNIVNGLPANFTFYNGYSNKYPTKAKEIADMLNPARLITLTSL